MGLPQRRSLTVAEPARGSLPGAPHPNVMLVIRFLVTGLVALLSLATAIIAILIVDFYNSNDPIIRPSWGSLIFLIILGLFTPIIYFGYNIFLPLMPFINYGDFLYSLFMVKIELLLQFAMCVLWVSGALAYANDLRGRENCQFDGYWHYEKPANFNHVCDLFEYATGFAYATFGVQVFLFVIELLYGMYIFLLLDQESLNEPHFEWGRRAYNYAQQSKQQQRQNAIGRSPVRATAVGGAGGAPAASYRDTGRRSPGSSVSSSAGVGSAAQGRRGAAYNDPDMESRASAPVSLGSRGRRGVAYGGMVDEDEESQIGGRPLSQSSSQGDVGGGPLAAAAAAGGRASSRGGSKRGSRRGPLSDEESGWHLREEDSER
ncbi:hypothetical protein PaG_00094 [Moesziomyces aphidis]|uniref:Uncharacterized protein n=3 Tax=Moesziomyces TaxID=63261 RepID=A0A081CLW0_PSEA2|nr:uncharacterized protein PAN0_020d5885 [Moesziomyces antarcticus]ETS65361.1 hypothetical protein PaG_00094 [Moesziomyces aphidis]GAK67656.1 conserved hypothetical protein [Moesziomyces antarcticus]SPO49111.1 uncharacterized protein PSANT_06802 [Moesziomyces antarcticus]